MSNHEEEYRRALDAYDEARRSLLDLAARAIHEAFIVSPVGLQLALSLTRVDDRQRLYDAIPLIVADVRLPWVKTLLTDAAQVMRTFERRQHADANEVRAITTSINSARETLAATIVRCPRDEGVVILRNVNTRLCVCGVKKRAGKTFVEYETVGGLAMGKVRVVTRGDTEWEVLP